MEFGSFARICFGRNVGREIIIRIDMNRNELYATLVAMVPVKADEKKDFRAVMRERN